MVVEKMFRMGPGFARTRRLEVFVLEKLLSTFFRDVLQERVFAVSNYKSAKAISFVKGFTLVELLVVISIIALLLSVLMPALSKAREAGKRAVCLNNLKSLAVTWMMYADDNNDRLVNAMTSPLRKKGLNWNWETKNPSFWSYFHGPSWVGWWDDPGNLKAQIRAIEIGTLYPYCENVKLYRFLRKS